MTIFPMVTISLSAVFLVTSIFHEGHGISIEGTKTSLKYENEIEISIFEKMEKEIIGKLKIAKAYDGFSWPKRMGLEEIISAINNWPLKKSKHALR